MSGDVGRFVEQALGDVQPATGRLSLALVQRRVSRRQLLAAATSFRRAADLLDEALALLPQRQEPTE